MGAPPCTKRRAHKGSVLTRIATPIAKVRKAIGTESLPDPRAAADKSGAIVPRDEPSPRLPKDVLPRIFKNLGVRAVSNARLVCKEWHQAVEANEADIWISISKALDLLPEGSKSRRARPLQRSVYKLEKEVATIRRRLDRSNLRAVAKAKLQDEMTALYRTHYHTWVPKVCRVCLRFDLGSPCHICSKLSGADWVRLRASADAFSIRVVDVQIKARKVFCEPPEYAPDNWRYGGIFYRLDDIMRYVIRCHGVPHAEEREKQLRLRGGVISIDENPHIHDI